MSVLKILILEDSATDAELEMYALRQAGFHPDWVRVQTEEEFLARLTPELDLIIADYQLPRFDGGKALERLQASGLDIPFIIVSGAIGEELAVALMKQGVDDYLQKDRLARLGQSVARALEQKRNRLEKAEAERALRELAARMEQQATTFDTLLSAVPDLLCLFDLDGRLTYANRAALASWRLPAEAAVGRSLADLMCRHGSAEQYQRDFRRAAAGEVARGESRDSDGGCIQYYFTPVPERDGTPRGVAFAARDISELKRVEETLRGSLEQLERERELREIFVSTLSHDLRTPLMAARMSTELMARREGSHSTLLQGRVIENIDRLDDMIQTLLDANLIRAGERLPVQPEPCALRRIVRDVLDEYATLHGDRFRLCAPRELDGYWDPRFLRRILENLLSNALKYGAAEAPITVSLEEAGEQVLLRVHNDGEPIGREDQAGLFEPFRRRGGDRFSRQQGWGIGLTLVRGAAEAHGGSVSVESDDEGTTFAVALLRDARSEPNAVAAG